MGTVNTDTKLTTHGTANHTCTHHFALLPARQAVSELAWELATARAMGKPVRPESLLALQYLTAHLLMLMDETEP